MPRLRASLAAVVLAAAAGSAQSPVTSLPTPAGPESGMYSLATGADGRTYLSWIDPLPTGGHALRFARLEQGRWAEPREIARGGDWFVNWADHPSLAAARDGRLFAHWLVHTGKGEGGEYGYAIRAATSADQGRSWTTVFEEGLRNVRDYSGFLTFLPTADGVEAVYLTPLAPDDGSGPVHNHIKTVGVARLTPDGRVVSRHIVDGDACSCCNTDIAETSTGAIAVYRDHDAGEIRDISIVRLVDGQWTSPAPVHRDGWRIAGCPTNGPAVAARDSMAAVAWFTAAGDRPQVSLALSRDGGATFDTPLRVDDGAPVGWADVALLPDGAVVVSWLERTGEARGEVRVRVARGSGVEPAVTVGRASSGRSTGVPMMAVAGGQVVVAWRDGGVKTALVTLPRPVSRR